LSYKNTDYLFASAYIKSKEKYLLTKERIEKMLGSKTADDALRILYEMGYGSDSENISAADYETLLFRELDKAYHTIISLTPEQKYFTVFLYQNDYHNVKTLLKAECLGVAADELLINANTIPLDQLTDMVRNRNYFNMREAMSQGIREVIADYGTSHDPQVIDVLLDKACYMDINTAVSKLKNDFIQGYFILKVDSINLKSFVRAKEMNKPRDFFPKIYIDGGSVPEKVFISGYDETLEQFADRLVIYGLQTLLLESIDITNVVSKFTSLEKLCDNLLIDYVRGAKYISFGVQPLICYLIAKENELKTVRIIMTSKLAGISSELIRERMSNTYV